VFCNKFVDHGGHHGDAAQALAQSRHPVVSSETWDVLHWAMHPALHPHIPMVFEIASV